MKSKLTINIKGNNIERFIKRLKNNNIEILNIIYVSDNEVNIKVYKEDFDDVLKLKRESIAFLTLDGVPSGEYRQLSIKEVKKLYGEKNNQE